MNSSLTAVSPNQSTGTADDQGRAYFDHNATTPMAEEVLQAMLPWLGRRDLGTGFGNASSLHRQGRAAQEAITHARAQVAQAIGALPEEVTFTSGGSEANNLLIKGLFAQENHAITLAVSAVEHPCVLQPAWQRARRGDQLLLLPTDEHGLVREDAFLDALRQRARYVSIMTANNETGVISPLATLAPQAAAAGVIVHSDAVQALGKLPIHFSQLKKIGVRALSLSAHKINGPQGIGALVADRALDLEPLIAGGGQEAGLRSGTENVAAIVGFGIAAERAERLRQENARHTMQLQTRLEAGLVALGAQIFGQESPRLPNTTCFAFAHSDGATWVGELDRLGFSVASGSACSSGKARISHVLSAMSISPHISQGAVRVSLAASNNAQEIDDFLKAVSQIHQRHQRLLSLGGAPT